MGVPPSSQTPLSSYQARHGIVVAVDAPPDTSVAGGDPTPPSPQRPGTGRVAVPGGGQGRAGSGLVPGSLDLRTKVGSDVLMQAADRATVFGPITTRVARSHFDLGAVAQRQRASLAWKRSRVRFPPAPPGLLQRELQGSCKGVDVCLLRALGDFDRSHGPGSEREGQFAGRRDGRAPAAGHSEAALNASLREGALVQ